MQDLIGRRLGHYRIFEKILRVPGPQFRSYSEQLRNCGPGTYWAAISIAQSESIYAKMAARDLQPLVCAESSA